MQTARGETAAAKNSYALVSAEQNLFRAAGGNADLELALFDADHGDRAEAVRLGPHRREASGRRCTRTTRSAGRSSAPATAVPRCPRPAPPNRLESADPLLAYHLGAIAACAGERTEAVAALRRAQGRNPRFHPALRARRGAAAASASEGRRHEAAPARPRLLALVAVPAAGAHPLGNFTVNQYARIQVAPAGVDVHFVLDQAEIPTLQMIQAHDSDGSGTIDGAETAAVRDALVRDITGAIALTVGGRPARLVPAPAPRSAFPAGQGGLSTTRLDLDLRADGVPLAGTPQQIAYTSTLRDRPGRLEGGRRGAGARCGRDRHHRGDGRPHERAALVPEGRARLAGRPARRDRRRPARRRRPRRSAPCSTDGNVAAAEAGPRPTRAGSSRWSTRAGR